MTFLKAGIALLVLAIGAGAFVLERQSNTQLREEVALLRNEVRDLAKQRAKAEAAPAPALANNAQVEADRAEIAKLREELETLKARAKEFGQATKEIKAAVAAAAGGKSAVDSLPVRLIPATEWKNGGRDTVHS